MDRILIIELFEGIMHQKDKKFIFFIVFMFLGIVMAIQFRSTLSANSLKSASAIQIEKLKAWINEETAANGKLKAQIEENMVQKEQYLKALIEEKNDYSLKREWEEVRLKAGFTDVKGPGIELKLDDADARQGEDTQLLIIHDQDIRIILNDLKKAGAQAISINGERISATSEQVCAGPTILINRNRYPVPYIINAIGDPDLLYDTLSKSERIAVMIEDKIRVDLKKSKEVIVPKFSNIDRLNSLISGLEVVNK